MSNIYKDYTPPAGNGGLFLKIEDGENVRLRVLSKEPVVFESDYLGTLSTKYAWLVYNHDEEKVQIFQGGATIYNAIAALATDEDWGDPTEYDIKVGRKGVQKETKYSVQPTNKSKEVPADLEDVDVLGIINKSDKNVNVQMLSDRIAGATPAQKQPKDNVPTVEDVDNPIDLDDIPF